MYVNLLILLFIFEGVIILTSMVLIDWNLLAALYTLKVEPGCGFIASLISYDPVLSLAAVQFRT